MSIIHREKERILIQCFTSKDSYLQQVAFALRFVPEFNFKAVVRNYYNHCENVYGIKFAEWRSVIKKLKDEGYTDINEGYY